MKKIFLIFSLVLIMGLLTGCYSNEEINEQLLKSIAKPSMNIDVLSTNSWYFFHEDRIYAYLPKLNPRYSDLKEDVHILFSCNLDGSDVKKIYSGYDISYAKIYDLIDNELFLYSENVPGIVKINILNGEATHCIENENFSIIPNTLKNGKVLVNSIYPNFDNYYTYFAKFDINNYKISDKKLINDIIVDGYYSLNTDKFYYVKGDYNYNLNVYEKKVYENNIIIYTYNTYNQNDNIVFTQDNYIFVVTSDKIVKIATNDYSVLEEKRIEKSDYKMVSGVLPGAATHMENIWDVTQVSTMEKPVFYDSQKRTIVEFNSESLSFDILVDTSEYQIGQYDFTPKVGLKYNNYLVVQFESNTIVYNYETKKYAVFDSCNYTVEGDYIYLMTYKGDYQNRNCNI